MTIGNCSAITFVMIAHAVLPALAFSQVSPIDAAPAVDPFPSTYADPAVPLLQLPTHFRARRTTATIATADDEAMTILDVEGAGCIRHMWFVFGQKEIEDVEIEIKVDGKDQAQVRMPFRSFFGELLDFEDYFINSAGIVNYPNFTVTNDPLISPKAQPGWNLYLPIPFSHGCQIKLYSKTPKRGAAMIDWQQYLGKVQLTPLRFHAQRNIAEPASTTRPFPIATAEGTGFLAGYVMGWRQRDHADMVFHNSGSRMLIDGETDPHVICGHNVEDDFGFSWGFNQYQTRWTGCPYRDNRGRTDQDGVFYRFFGPDPIPFRSSLLFSSNARPDDYEAVSYYYKVIDSKAPTTEFPRNWVAVGLFNDGGDFDKFHKPAIEIVQTMSQSQLPETITHQSANYSPRQLVAERGWLRLEHTLQHRPAYPPTDHSYFVRTTLHSDGDRDVTLRLAADDWLIVWLNGSEIGRFDHSNGFETVNIAAQLKAGENQLVIKTNNRMNRDRHIWVLNCAVLNR
ncbi:MAG: DUF2961 domain-containing protein [Pirellulaceae bacterium]